MRTAKKLHRELTVAARAVHDSPGARAADRERANDAAFDETARSLGLVAGESRGRRWFSRLGALLRRARERQQLGQEAVAAKAAVTQPYLSRLENGLLDRRGPTMEVLLRCSEAAGCDVEITLRSSKDGRVVGHVSSSDLDRAAPQVSGSVRRSKDSPPTSPRKPATLAVAAVRLKKSKSPTSGKGDVIPIGNPGRQLTPAQAIAAGREANKARKSRS